GLRCHDLPVRHAPGWAPVANVKHPGRRCLRPPGGHRAGAPEIRLELDAQHGIVAPGRDGHMMDGSGARRALQFMRSAAVIAGVDEAGRGPLAGPVYAAAVVLDPARPIRGLADSKQLTPARREMLAERIRERALAWHVAWADVEEIDSLNILGATLLAMRRAVLGLAVRPEL